MVRTLGHDKPITQYLERYAEPEARLASELPRPYAAVLIVPLRDESAVFLGSFDAAFAALAGRGLVIAVFNSDAACSPRVAENNAAAWSELERCGPAVRLAGHPPAVLIEAQAADLLLIDRSQPGLELPPKAGVGLARKIGCDVALTLWAQGRLRANLIHHTDADAELPADYFATSSGRADEVSALLYAYRHRPSGDEALDRATLAYETWLRYPVFGLASAGSPYAYHSLASTLAVTPWHYAAARGFPPREAGEDFHLLGKLVKLAPASRLDSSPVTIRARRSSRAPIGTGVRVQQVLAGTPLAFPNPEVFPALATLLQALEIYSETTDDTAFAVRLDRSPTSPLLRRAADAIGISAALSDARQQTKTPSARWRRLVTWLDALRTRRLLRQFELEGLASVPWEQARLAPFLPPGVRSLDAETASAVLFEAERSLPPRVGLL